MASPKKARRVVAAKRSKRADHRTHAAAIATDIARGSASAVQADAAEARAAPTPAAPIPALSAASAPGPATPGTLQLGSSLSIREVANCAAQLKTLAKDGPIELDLTRLETIDTAGVQLLLAAAAAAQRSGFRLRLHGALALKNGAARALGLDEHLGELAEIVS